MIIDFSGESANRIYHTMIQTLIPRPVAWVLSENENQRYNLAPFSYFSAVSSDPPLLMLSVGKKLDGSVKDTRLNIVERSEFVIHIPHRDQAGLVTASSQALPSGESELELLNLATTEFGDFRLPRLIDCRIAYACERYRVEDITDKQAMILGRVRAVYIDDKVIASSEGGRLNVQASKVDPLARLGGDEYAALGDLINVPRPE